MIKKIVEATACLILLLTFSCNNKENCNLLVEFEKVNGLYENAEVTINGYKIGSVKKMELANNKVITTLSINNKVKIPNTAVFKIKSSGLIANKHIEISNINGSGNFLFNGAKISGIYDAEITSTPISIDSIVVKIAKPILDSLGYDVTPKKPTNE